ncbi:MAG: glycosyltransferase [gamma proteobacterium symbiont of Taylorina sp.]|nr:glycosyltransferase [gamma proteobacterium symbiont of Taylorina sp.]
MLTIVYYNFLLCAERDFILLDISIVLHNSEQYLERLIASLKQQTFPLSEISLLIYDNNSSDNTLLILDELIRPLQKKFQQYILIKGNTRIACSKAQNLIIAHGKNDFIFLLKPQVELSETGLDTLYNIAKRDKSDVSAWEPRLSPYEHPKTYDPITLETSWFTNTAVMIRRASFEQVKGFKSFFCPYGEDVDLSWRLRDIGSRLRYIPQSIITYNPDFSSTLKLIDSIRINLFLHTRFGSLKSIYNGLRQHTLLLNTKTNKQPIQLQFIIILKNLIKFFLRLQHRHKTSKKNNKPVFSNWDYDTSRIGNTHDISPCLSLKNDKPVSILIRTMGKQKLLAQALSCIENQTYQLIEVVIIEDGQQTLDNFLIPYQKKLNINYQALGHNKGRCHAGNQAMENATGDYYLFLDEDDLLYADHIEQLLIAIEKNHTKLAYSFAFELPSVYAEDNNSILHEGHLFSHFKQGFSFPALLQANYLPINSVLFHHSLYHECGGFNPEIDLNEDWNLWVRFSINYRPFVNIAKTTAIYRVPLKQKVNRKRHQQLLEQQQRVRELQSGLMIEINVEELLKLIK